MWTPQNWATFELKLKQFNDHLTLHIQLKWKMKMTQMNPKKFILRIFWPDNQKDTVCFCCCCFCFFFRGGGEGRYSCELCPTMKSFKSKFDKPPTEFKRGDESRPHPVWDSLNKDWKNVMYRSGMGKKWSMAVFCHVCIITFWPTWSLYHSQPLSGTEPYFVIISCCRFYA